MKPAENVIATPSKYTFSQAYRCLLRELSQNGFEDPERIRVSPLLDLNFPRSEVAKVERGYDEKGDLYFIMQVNLMGLYGSLSPLPKYITEELLQSVGRDEWGAKVFLDILHQHLFQLVYQARTRYLPHYLATNPKPHALSNQAMMESLGGLSSAAWYQTFPDKAFILRHINVFRHQRGTVLGLKQLLAGLLKVKQIAISQCQRRRIYLPQEQQTQLGLNASSLGKSAVVGHCLSDVEGKVTVSAKGIAESVFDYWVMSNKNRDTLKAMIRDFVGNPLILWLSLEIEPSSRDPKVGEDDVNLGLNAWLSGSVRESSHRCASIRLL